MWTLFKDWDKFSCSPPLKVWLLGTYFFLGCLLSALMTIQVAVTRFLRFYDPLSRFTVLSAKLLLYDLDISREIVA